MDAVLMSMPGALRLRSLCPLTEEDGSCPRVYDVERSAVLEVPEDLQLHIAQALETGDPDEDLLGWLMSEDLLTRELPAGDGEPSAAEPPVERSAFWLRESRSVAPPWRELTQAGPVRVVRGFDEPPRLPVAGVHLALLWATKPS